MNGRADRQILYVTHRTPYPPDKGDRIRNYHVLRYLSQHARVDLATLADEPVSEQTWNELRTHCRRVALQPIGRLTRLTRMAWSWARGRALTEGAFASPALRRTLRQWTRDTKYDAVLLSSSGLLPYARALDRTTAPLVVDLIDVDSQKWTDLARARSWPMSWLYATESRRVAALEREALAEAQACVVVSEAEAKLLGRDRSQGRVVVIPCGVDLEYFRPGDAATGERVVFVGALNYEPNIDGMEWFCQHVWPRLRERRPGAHLQIVGRRPGPRVRRLAALPGAEVVADVPDVRPYLTRATAVIVPLRVARGVQNKVLEALAMAKPVVASPASLGGVGAQPERDVLRADTTEDWLRQLGRVFDEPRLRDSLAGAGRRYVEQHHAWDECLSPFAEILGLNDAAPSSNRSAQFAESISS